MIICLSLNESRSLRQTAAEIPNGTHTIMDPKTTTALPTKIDSAPNSSGWPDGYHLVEVKNSLNPSIWKEWQCVFKDKKKNKKHCKRRGRGNNKKNTFSNPIFNTSDKTYSITYD